jgi:hypothetical protein
LAVTFKFIYISASINNNLMEVYMNPTSYNLDQVGKAFDDWRAQRTDNSPIPEELWSLVNNIYHHYPRGSLCARLGLSSGQLKRRGYPPQAGEHPIDDITTESTDAFVHVAPESSSVASMTRAPVIEVVRPDGTIIRLQHLPESHMTLFFQQLVGC